MFAFIRRTEEGESILVVSNFTPVLREDYRIGVDIAGIYQEVLNTDRLQYGGQDRCQKQGVLSKAIPMHHCKHSISVTLPPLTTLYFQLQTSLSKKRERVNL